MTNLSTEEISNLVNNFLVLIKKQGNNKKHEIYYSAFQEILNGNFSKYNILNSESYDENGIDSIDELQKVLSKVNEKSRNRKKRGVYYTPTDVTNYVIVNSFINYVIPENDRMYSYDSGCRILLDNPERLRTLILERVIFDPTAGAGEFLVNTLMTKFELLLQINSAVHENDYLSILNTIKGNDISNESTDICKIRLFIEISKYVSDCKVKKIVKILNSNFTNYDFVLIKETDIPKCDIILGNPPYVEYGKVDIKPKNKYGNIYADVLQNSLLSLRPNGVYGLVVPLSYVATSRMQKIRNYVEENTRKQIILSFADRPDCLFTGVHQKLCIIFGVKSREEHQIFTSNYRHWYKSEREQLLNGCSVLENHFRHDGFIPKIGNEIEGTIFRKIFTNTIDNVYELSRNENVENEIFVNMRATFYIKSFTFNPGSKEYKCFRFEDNQKDFILCLLNSSLYFLFWTIVSDCWHITTKELKHMYVPNVDFDREKFIELADMLEEKLEETKKYVGTVQTDYEYKHKECFDIINKIDDELSFVYDLSQEELSYIKKFALKYRMGTDK